MVVSRDLRAHHLAGLAGPVVHVDSTDLPLLVADSREDDLLHAEGPRLLEDGRDVLAGVGPLAVLDTEHEAELGEVGHDDVRHLAELAHSCGEVGAEYGVQLPSVGHHGVDVDGGALVGQVPEQLLHDVDLLEGSEEPGVERIELDVQRLPVVVDGDHVLREVAVGETGEPAGVGGEYRCRESGAFDAHGRDDRESDGQGAPADAGNVMDCQNPFLVHAVAMTVFIEICAPGTASIFSERVSDLSGIVATVRTRCSASASGIRFFQTVD